MKLLLLFVFVGIAAAKICQDDSECDPDECCTRGNLLLIRECFKYAQLDEDCHTGDYSLVGYCPCAAGLYCEDAGNSGFVDFFAGDGWCRPTPADMADQMPN
ncbi:PREDICTED: venom protein 164-like [Branchiostoma belcheri]|uniref:Venom protein 164-like n=1 Tax=Branchiostoma belcheri TaxID=7741 RepID=A0A6P4YMV2_BRABE|nr:PREDICTED: venom protein 164-like [Branchiostoma belcheri]